MAEPRRKSSGCKPSHLTNSCRRSLSKQQHTSLWPRIRKRDRQRPQNPDKRGYKRPPSSALGVTRLAPTRANITHRYLVSPSLPLVSVQIAADAAAKRCPLPPRNRRLKKNVLLVKGVETGRSSCPVRPCQAQGSHRGAPRIPPTMPVSARACPRVFFPLTAQCAL